MKNVKLLAQALIAAQKVDKVDVFISPRLKKHPPGCLWSIAYDAGILDYELATELSSNRAHGFFGLKYKEYSDLLFLHSHKHLPNTGALYYNDGSELLRKHKCRGVLTKLERSSHEESNK
jgi:hypothetical protein